MWTITIGGEADSVLCALLDAIQGYNVDVVVAAEPVGTVHVRGVQGRTLICEATDDEYYEPTGERIEIELRELDSIHVY